jgi:hypothetical protein
MLKGHDKYARNQFYFSSNKFLEPPFPITTMVRSLYTIVDDVQQTLWTIFHFLTAHYFSQIQSPNLASYTMKNIVILGGSYSGISTAHRILKQGGKTEPFKITLVSPNTEFYWSMGSPRGIIPGQSAMRRSSVPSRLDLANTQERNVSSLLQQRRVLIWRRDVL